MAGIKPDNKIKQDPAGANDAAAELTLPPAVERPGTEEGRRWGEKLMKPYLKGTIKTTKALEAGINRDFTQLYLRQRWEFVSPAAGTEWFKEVHPEMFKNP